MSDKKAEADDSEVFIKTIKRRGSFDKIKKDVLEELQEMNEIKVSRDYMLNLVRINFDKQSKERRYPPNINERRTMLKNMIGNATMFDSLANSIQHSSVFKEAAQKLADEVDKLVPQHYPDLVFNSTTKQWEVPRADSSTIPNTETTATDITPTPPHTYSNFMTAFSQPPPIPPQVDNESDMELDSSSSNSSAEDSREFRSKYNPLHPPPPPPNF